MGKVAKSNSKKSRRNEGGLKVISKHRDSIDDFLRSYSELKTKENLNKEVI